MVLDMKVILKIMKEKVKGYFTIMMVINLKVILKIMKEKEKE